MPRESETNVQTRVPLRAREVEIFRRMKKIFDLPVTMIALAVNRNKTSVHVALSDDWATEKRVPRLAALLTLGGAPLVSACCLPRARAIILRSS